MAWDEFERENLAGELRAAGPDGPTLCAGWRTRHLALHLVRREREPWQLAVDAAPSLNVAAMTRFEEAAQRLEDPDAYARVVDRFASKPSRWSPASWAGEQMNLLEYFVHGEDVRRASDDPGAPPPVPRVLSTLETDVLWRRFGLVSRVLYRKSPVGLVLVLPDGRRVTAGPRASEETGKVVVRGPVGEIVLHAFGRGARALVQVEGSSEAVELLDSAFPRLIG